MLSFKPRLAYSQFFLCRKGRSYKNVITSLFNILLEKGVLGRATSGEAELEKLEAENMATVASYGDTFMEVVCRDACDGHDVGRVRTLERVKKEGVGGRLLI